MRDAPALRNKGRRQVHVLTVGGEIELFRRYFWSEVSGGRYPADVLIGIDGACASPGARDFCCSMGIVQDFEQGAQDLARIVHPHPTLSETLMECAEMFYGHSTHAYSRKRS